MPRESPNCATEPSECRNDLKQRFDVSALFHRSSGTYLKRQRLKNPSSLTFESPEGNIIILECNAHYHVLFELRSVLACDSVQRKNQVYRQPGLELVRFLHRLIIILCEGGVLKPHQYGSAEDAVKVVKSGDRVFIHSVAAAPQKLINALCDRHEELSSSYSHTRINSHNSQKLSFVIFILKDLPRM